MATEILTHQQAARYAALRGYQLWWDKSENAGLAYALVKGPRWLSWTWFNLLSLEAIDQIIHCPPSLTSGTEPVSDMVGIGLKTKQIAQGGMRWTTTRSLLRWRIPHLRGYVRSMGASYGWTPKMSAFRFAW